MIVMNGCYGDSIQWLLCHSCEWLYLVALVALIASLLMATMTMFTVVCRSCLGSPSSVKRCESWATKASTAPFTRLTPSTFLFNNGLLLQTLLEKTIKKIN